MWTNAWWTKEKIGRISTMARPRPAPGKRPFVVIGWARILFLRSCSRSLTNCLLLASLNKFVLTLRFQADAPSHNPVPSHSLSHLPPAAWWFVSHFLAHNLLMCLLSATGSSFCFVRCKQLYLASWVSASSLAGPSTVTDRPISDMPGLTGLSYFVICCLILS